MKSTQKKVEAKDGERMDSDNISDALEPAIPEAVSGLFDSMNLPLCLVFKPV